MEKQGRMHVLPSSLSLRLLNPASVLFIHLREFSQGGTDAQIHGDTLHPPSGLFLCLPSRGGQSSEKMFRSVRSSVTSVMDAFRARARATALAAARGAIVKSAMDFSAAFHKHGGDAM